MSIPRLCRRCRVWTFTLSFWILISGPVLEWPALEAQAQWIDEKIEEVYLTLEEALRIALPDSEEILTQTISFTPEQRKQVEAASGRPALEPYWTIYVGKSGGRVDGYAVVTEELGMYKPITSIVGITSEGRVREVAVMVYRESRGGDVRRKRFLNQYRGKRLEDPIRIHRDIINVTGATLSVRSMNAQVRKALAIVEEAFLRKGGS